MKFTKDYCILLALTCVFGAYLLAAPEPCDPMLEALGSGADIGSVVILTHLSPDLREAALKRLREDPKLKDLPIIFLNAVEGESKLGSIDPKVEPLMKDRGVVVLSANGSLGKNMVNSPDVALAGGACGMCLSVTLRQLVFQFFNNTSRDSMNISIHRDLSYGGVFSKDGILVDYLFSDLEIEEKSDSSGKYLAITDPKIENRIVKVYLKD